MLKALNVTGVLALISLALPSQAQEYRDRTVAGWDIGAISGDACLMTMEYEGEGSTRLILGLNIAGEPLLMASNANWTVKDKEELELDYELSNGSYKKHFTIGTKVDYGGGIATKFESKFPQYFAESSYLHIERDGTVIDQLSLKGTGAAVGELRRCVAIVKAKADAEAREKARWQHIPKDPFAKPTTANPDKEADR